MGRGGGKVTSDRIHSLGKDLWKIGVTSLVYRIVGGVAFMRFRLGETLDLDLESC
jgi:hypothetical protein